MNVSRISLNIELRIQFLNNFQKDIEQSMKSMSLMIRYSTKLTLGKKELAKNKISTLVKELIMCLHLILLSLFWFKLRPLVLVVNAISMLHSIFPKIHLKNIRSTLCFSFMRCSTVGNNSKISFNKPCKNSFSQFCPIQMSSWVCLCKLMMDLH